MGIRERLFRPSNTCGRWSFFTAVVVLGVVVVLLLNYALSHFVDSASCQGYGCKPATATHFSIALLTMTASAMAAIATFCAHELNLVEDIVWSTFVWDLSERRWHKLQGAPYLNRLCSRAQRGLRWATVALAALAVLSFGTSLILLASF